MTAFSLGDLRAIWPSLAAFAFGLLVLINDTAFPRRNAMVSTVVTGFALLLSLCFNGMLGQEAGPASQVVFSGMVAVDRYGVLLNHVILIAGLGALVMGHDHLRRVGVDLPEYNPLLLFAVSGMTLLVVANDLILLFVALELMSIAVYVLCAINRGDYRGVEGAAKYFVLGAFSSALLLYGVAFVFGATGTTRLDYIAEWLGYGRTVLGEPLLAVGLALLLVGFGFKVAAAPFHMWSPDVYQGAPTPVTSFMATAVKAASFAALGRVLLVAFLPDKPAWTAALWAMAALTMLWGNIGALVQTDLKRMLAYSSIGHAGYLLMAFVGVSAEGVAHNPRVAGLLLYLLAYTIMTVGAFAALSLLTRDGEDDTRLDRLDGLAARHPWLSAGLAICLLSLAGIPPTLGFVGKFYLFAATVEGGYPGLAVVGAIAGAIGVYYYLRPLVSMYMTKGEGLEPPALNRPALGALLVACAAVLALGVWPGPLVDWCREALLSIAGV